MKLAAYSKFIAAVLGEGLSVAVALYGSANKWVAMAIAVGSALGVYAVPNRSPAPPAGP